MTREEKADIFNNHQVRWAIIFYTLYLFTCMLIKYTGWFGSYRRLFWMELLLAAITTGFVYYNRESLASALSFRRLRWPAALGMFLLGMLTSSVVSWVILLLHIKVKNAGIYYYTDYRLMIYSVAIMPALFEELAFRGVLYNYFAAVTEERRVVMLTATIFAAMHLNFIALLWLLPLGFYLGYLRKKHHTVWYGALFHFGFNLMICLQAIL